MVDHSPPRDARKRKFQTLERIPCREHSDAVRNRPSLIPQGPSSYYTTHIGQSGSTFVYGGEDENEVSRFLPVKNKVSHLTRRGRISLRVSTTDKKNSVSDKLNRDSDTILTFDEVDRSRPECFSS